MTSSAISKGRRKASSANCVIVSTFLEGPEWKCFQEGRERFECYEEGHVMCEWLKEGLESCVKVDGYLIEG